MIFCLGVTHACTPCSNFLFFSLSRLPYPSNLLNRPNELFEWKIKHNEDRRHITPVITENMMSYNRATTKNKDHTH